MILNKTKEICLLLYIVILISMPIILLLLPSDFFDIGQSLCLSKLLFNKHCWGCGMTRAIQHLIHFDIDLAYSYNKLSFIVLPLLIILCIKEIRRKIRLLFTMCYERKLL